MEITLQNNTLSPVVLFSVDVDPFSVDSMSKRERKEGVVRPGAYNRFYVPGVPSELRIKDFNTGTTIYTYNINPSAREGYSQASTWFEQENPNHSIALSMTGAVTSTSEYSGLWTYRIFDPTYVIGDQTPQKELELILADGFVFNFQTATKGTFGLPDGGFPLDLNVTVQPGVGGEPVFDIVGTGRPPETDGWEYDYRGHLTRNWSNAAADQRPFLVGSVIRAKPHNGQPGGWRRAAGEVFSFIAVKQQPPFTWDLLGSWTYRSFLNDPTPVYQTARPTVLELILQEGVFKLESPTSTTLKGAGEWLGTVGAPGRFFLDLTEGTVRPDDASFEIKGTGRPDTDTQGREYHYQGHLTRTWPNGIKQRPALVGSLIRAQPNPETASALPFIAVKQP